MVKNPWCPKCNHIMKESGRYLQCTHCGYQVRIEEERREIVNLCEFEPDTAIGLLDSLEKKYTEIKLERNRFIIKLLRMNAYGSKGLRQLMREKTWVDITTATGSELRDSLGLTNEHLDYLEKSLIIFSNLEKNYPKFIKQMSKEELVAMIDGPAMALERCRPGRVQQILGKTKLCYFGSDRIRHVKGLDIPDGELKTFLYNNFFSASAIIKFAVITMYGKDIKGRKYIRCSFFERSFDVLGTGDTLEKAGLITSIYLFDDETSGDFLHRE